MIQSALFCGSFKWGRLLNQPSWLSTMRGPEERREVPLLVASALLLHAPVMQLRLTYVCSVSVPLLKGEHGYKFGVYITVSQKNLSPRIRRTGCMQIGARDVSGDEFALLSSIIPAVLLLADVALNFNTQGDYL